VRRRRSVVRAAAVVAVPVALLASSCTAKRPDATPAVTVAPTTTFAVPAGGAAVVLPLMLDEVAGLSAKVSANSGDGAAADRIEQMWASIKDEVQQTHPELVEDFEFVVTRCRLAADRNRPADADRAYRNLQTLLATYLD
jgi:hypothetical protein